jgi:adenylyl-sulfate kinase
MVARAEGRGFTVWLTGLSGAGKSTLAGLLAERVRASGLRVEVLDGDEVRTHLSSELGFGKDDRDRNVRRIGWVCELLNRNGVGAIVAAISPYRATREEVRMGLPNFVEVHVECPIEVLAARDPKGLYQRALAGEIPHFTGISDPYEPPLAPEVVCRTDGGATPEQSVVKIVQALTARGLLPQLPADVADGHRRWCSSTSALGC